LKTSLAYAELFLTVAALVRIFEFELVDSSIEALTVYRDYALSFNEHCSYGVNFRIAKVLLDD